MARSLLVAARNWTLYPPEHPAVESSVERLCDATRQSSLGSAFGIGIRSGAAVEEPRLANTWDRDSRGGYPYAVVEAVDPESVAIDPLKYL